jgi:hypothetical protein
MYNDSMIGVQLELTFLKVVCKVQVLLLTFNGGRGPMFIADFQLLLPVMASYGKL